MKDKFLKKLLNWYLVVIGLIIFLIWLVWFSAAIPLDLDEPYELSKLLLLLIIIITIFFALIYINGKDNDSWKNYYSSYSFYSNLSSHKNKRRIFKKVTAIHNLFFCCRRFIRIFSHSITAKKRDVSSWNNNDYYLSYCYLLYILRF